MVLLFYKHARREKLIEVNVLHLCLGIFTSVATKMASKNIIELT